LIRSQETTPRYWSSGGEAEVDFLIQYKNTILPVEVKSDVNVRSRSLALYGEKYREATKLKLRFSLRNLSLDGDILNIPLFLIDAVDRFVDMGLAASTMDSRGAR
jgi:predicted AAA+ superfamily ATPase